MFTQLFPPRKENNAPIKNNAPASTSGENQVTGAVM